MTGIPISESKKLIDTYGFAELIRYKDSLCISTVQSKKLELLFDLTKRISLSEFKDKILISGSSDAGDYFIKELQFYRNEVLLVAFLDSQNRIIKTSVMSHGTVNQASVYPREIVYCALKYNANAVILAHNHPGGSLQPSLHDVELTKKIKTALLTIDTTLIDHIIVADNKYFSFAAKGLINF